MHVTEVVFNCFARHYTMARDNSKGFAQYGIQKDLSNSQDTSVVAPGFGVDMRLSISITGENEQSLRKQAAQLKRKTLANKFHIKCAACPQILRKSGEMVIP